ncbi:MAG: hypothetical protein CBC74_000640 [Crocinitomicaceae bacterium TMED114]|nr:MAG: hypothetical protein CBC74_000640 [Crocinitomicaceae bacterium TMED114]
MASSFEVLYLSTSVSAPSVILFDLNALVLNMQGALHEGVSAAFRTMDFHLEEDVAARAVGQPYPEAVRTVYCDELGLPEADEDRMTQLCQMVEKVVGRFVQFSSSLFPSPRTANVITGLRRAGHPVGLFSELDDTTYGLLMQRMGWDANALFDEVVTGQHAATKDDILSDLLGRFEFQSGQQRVFVGAQPVDALPAALFGCDRILIRDAGDAESEELLGEPAFESFHSMTDLADLLRSPSVSSKA